MRGLETKRVMRFIWHLEPGSEVSCPEAEWRNVIHKIKRKGQMFSNWKFCPALYIGQKKLSLIVTLTAQPPI